MNQETTKRTEEVTKTVFDTDDIERFLIEKYNLDGSVEFTWNMTYTGVLEVVTRKAKIERI